MRPFSVAFAAALALVAGAASSSELDPGEAQALFERGQAALQAGDAGGAASLFDGLHRAAPTPRVKLELARALLVAGDGGRAYELFREVYDDPFTPAGVRRNIRPLMERAELMHGRVRWGARLASDSNPSRTARGGTVYFNGIPFEYVPPSSGGTAFGVEPYLSAERLMAGGIVAKTQLSARIFRDPGLVSGSFHGSLGFPLPGAASGMVQLALDGRVARDQSHAMPSVEAWRRFVPAGGWEMGGGMQAGYIASTNEGASGPYWRPYAFMRAPLPADASAFVRLSAEKLDARNGFYSYVTPKAEVGVDFEAAGFSLSPKVEASVSFYREHDWFWGVTRRDVTWRPSLGVSHRAVSYRGFTPEVTLFYETRSSNIAISSYSQAGATVNLRSGF